MEAGVVKNIFFAETQNGIHNVYIRHKSTQDNLSRHIYASRGTQTVKMKNDTVRIKFSFPITKIQRLFKNYDTLLRSLKFWQKNVYSAQYFNYIVYFRLKPDIQKRIIHNDKTGSIQYSFVLIWFCLICYCFSKYLMMKSNLLSD